MTTSIKNTDSNNSKEKLSTINNEENQEFRENNKLINEITESELRKLYLSENMTSREIAKVYNCSKNDVLKKLHEFNIPIRKIGIFRALSDSQIRVATELFNQGYKISEIQQKLNLKHKDSIIAYFKSELKNRACELFDNGYKIAEIARELGLGSETIRTLVKKEKINNSKDSSNIFEIRNLLNQDMSISYISYHLGLNINKIKHLLEEDIVLRYLQGENLTNLIQFFQTSDPTIRKILKKYHIVHLLPYERSHFGLHIRLENNNSFNYWRPFTDLQNEIIVGELLGDGNIDLHNFNSLIDTYSLPSLEEYKTSLDTIQYFRQFNELSDIKDLPQAIIKFNSAMHILSNSKVSVFRFVKSILELRYILDSFGYHFSINEYINLENINFQLFSLKNKEFLKFHMNFWTKSSMQMSHLKFAWYTKNRKIVPKFVELTSTSVLCWYIGDGTLTNASQIRIASQSFNKEENESLIIALAKVGIKANLAETVDKRNQKKYWIINIGVKTSVEGL